MNHQGPVFWVCRSSAGSGKTYSLVKQFLTLCLRDKAADAYVHILAITFTNNAAAEMKGRILARLHDFTKGTQIDKDSQGGQLFWLLQSELQIDPLELEMRAKNTLSHILHHYHRFSVSTIDSFIHRIVRAFSRDLSQHPDFNIEMDSDRVLEEVVDRCLDQAGKVDAVTKYLKKLVQIQMEDGKSWNPKSVMLEYAKTLTTEWGMAAMESQKEAGLTLADFEKIFQNLFVIKDHLMQTPKLLAAQIHDLLWSCSQDKNDHARKGYFVGVFAKMKESNTLFYDGNPFIKTELSSWWTQGEEASWFRTKEGNIQVKHLFESNAGEITKKIAELWEWFHGSEIKQVYLLDSIAKNFYAMGLVHYLHALSEGIKEERNFLMIQDFHQMIAKVMINNPTPFVYEKVGERYDHLLFDEFQDTSKLQWRNFLPLVHQSMSKGGEVFVVGDGKQSIYRWRNGDVHQFVNLPAIPKDDGLMGLEALLSQGYKSMELNTNRRSHQNVVLFNNAYFDAIREKMTNVNKKVYVNQAQLPHHPDDGFVRYKLFQNKATAREDMMVDLVQSIQAAHADGFAYSDMAILTRKGRKEAAPIAAALKEHGIPMNTHDSFLLSLSAKVRTVMAYLSFLAKPKEIYFRFDLLRSLSELEELSFDLTLAIDACMVVKGKEEGKQRRVLGPIEGFLNQWNSNLRVRWETGLSAYDLAKSFIDDLQLGMDEYLEFLLDQLSQKSTQWGYYPTETIAWWSKAKEKLCIQSNVSDDAIKIMTIHRSKGLEFPVVFYPRFQSKNPSQNIWVPNDVVGIPLKDVYLKFGASEPKYYQPQAFFEEYNNQMLDQFNLMYVAQTRAEERLYILQEEIVADKEDGDEVAVIDTLFTQTFKEVFEAMGIQNFEDAWSLGEPSKKKGSSQLTAVEIREMKTQVKSKKINIRYAATKRNEDHVHWMARKRGDRTHAFLQMMLQKRNVQQALDIFNQSHLPAQLDEEKAWETIVMDKSWMELVISFPEIQWRIEESLLLDGGRELRPDAYRVKEDCVELIDFKTGKEKAEHLGQIDDYSKVLFDIWKLPVKGMLYYTENQKWIHSTYQGQLF